MGQLTAGEARSQATIYNHYLEEIIYQVEKNFKDMDFENANRREEMKEIIQKIKKECKEVKEDLNSLHFES